MELIFYATQMAPAFIGVFKINLNQCNEPTVVATPQQNPNNYMYFDKVTFEMSPFAVSPF